MTISSVKDGSASKEHVLSSAFLDDRSNVKEQVDMAASSREMRRTRGLRLQPIQTSSVLDVDVASHGSEYVYDFSITPGYTCYYSMPRLR